MHILVACEESQRVCKEFRLLGHEAYSCDIQNCSGGHPEWHIKRDVVDIMNGYCSFITEDHITHDINTQWDITIAFPPCTYLTNVATRWHSLKSQTLDEINTRTVKRFSGMCFFMCIATAKCDKIAIENPVGVMNTVYRAPDQIIEPYFFAESENDVENYVTKKDVFMAQEFTFVKTHE